MKKNNSGFDNLSNQLLKKLLPALLTPLEIIVNKSLSEGVSPTEMKMADVVPLLKSEKNTTLVLTTCLFLSYWQCQNYWKI